MSNNALYSLLNDGSPITRTLAVITTLDFPSVSAAGTQTLTVTCPGASVGDIVALGLPATVDAGIVFDARVSAADTITVRAMNITASSVDPASATYEFVVFKLV
jgi:hypothetical protein